MVVIGIKGVGHDTGAAILSDDGGQLRIAAIAEARINRVKHSWRYPLLSIQYCLDAFGLSSLDQVDVVALDWHVGQFSRIGPSHRQLPSANNDDFLLYNFAVNYGLRVPDEKLMYVEHLAAHAASAYYLSPFDEAAVQPIVVASAICLHP